MGSIKGVRRGKYTVRTLNPSGEVYCFKCNKCFKRKAILRHHIRTKHLNFLVRCPVCANGFVSTYVCKRHLKNVHHIASYSQFDLTLKKDNKRRSKTKSTIETQQTSQKATEISPSLKKLSFKGNTAFESMRNVLSLEENQKFGKHLVAKCDIDIGQVVIASSAFASIEYLSSNSSCCFHCGQDRGTNFIQCLHCINLYFCSKRCSLNQIHRSKCNTVFNRSDCYTTRLVCEIITVAFKTIPNIEILLDYCKGLLFFNKSSQNCQPPYSIYGEMLQLKGHIEERHYAIAQRVVACVLQLPEFESPEFSLPQIRRLLFSLAYRHATTIRHNSFSEESVITKGGISTSFAIYDIASRINHSCSPNLEHVIDDNNMTHCVTIRPIKKGEQVFINYVIGMDFETNEERREYIKLNWDFFCECEKCIT